MTKELKEKTIQFLKIAEKHNLCFKWSKCDFNAKEILILGVVVGRREVQMRNDKVKAIKEQKTPTKIKEVESILGFANFYQYFIKNFSHIEKPFNELKGKKEWKEYQKAFKELKDKIPGQLVLTLPKKKENLEYKLMLQNMQLEKSYLRNKKGNGNILYFYQEQCKQLKETIRSITRNYWLQ